MIPKLNDTYHITGLYEKLNIINKLNSYTLSYISNINSQLDGSKNLLPRWTTVSSYHISVNYDDVDKTTITTSHGIFHFLYNTQSFKNGSTTFQSFIDRIFKELDYVCYY